MKTEKLYKVIAKIGNNTDGSARCVKYHCSDLLSLKAFFDRKFPKWTWFNVYSKATGKELARFTKYNPPQSKHI
jgi:hypothetical protein